MCSFQKDSATRKIRPHMDRARLSCSVNTWFHGNCARGSDSVALERSSAPGCASSRLRPGAPLAPNLARLLKLLFSESVNNANTSTARVRYCSSNRANRPPAGWPWCETDESPLPHVTQERVPV